MDFAIEATTISALSLLSQGCVNSGKCCYLSEPKFLICVVISHLQKNATKSLRCTKCTVAKVNITLLLWELVPYVSECAFRAT